MTMYFCGIVALMFVGVSRAMWLHTHPAGRWGRERIVTGTFGDGAYRSTTLYESRELRAPRRVLWAGMLSRTWAALTALFFAPAGLLATLLLGGAGEHSPFGPVFVIATLALSISGLALAAALVRAAGIVARREAFAPITTTLTWSHLHHALVFANFFSAALVLEPQCLGVAAATVLPPCLVGVLITLLLASAERRAAAVID